jgi:hypothetical protein
MASKDFTTFTERDPNNKYTVTASKIDIVGMTTKTVDSGVYEGGNNYNKIPSSTSWLWKQNTISGGNVGETTSISLSQSNKNIGQARTDADETIAVYDYINGNDVLHRIITSGSGGYSSSNFVFLPKNVERYFEMFKEFSAGSNDKITVRIYSDPTYVAAPIATLEVLFPTAINFSHLWGYSSVLNGGGNDALKTAYVEDLRSDMFNGAVAITELDFERGIGRGIMRGIGRGMN